MIIKALTIENFKVIREPVRVEFRPITLLFGPNSAGKSTIVQALHYAREILERNNLDVDRTVGTDESFDLGGFSNLTHKHDLNLPIKLKFEFSLSPLADLSDFFTDKVDNAWIEFEIKWSNFLGAPLVTSCTIGLDGEHFARIVCAEDGKRTRITDINFDHHLTTNCEDKEDPMYLIVSTLIKKDDVKNIEVALARAVKMQFLLSKGESEADSSTGQGSTVKLEPQLFVDQQTALPRYVKLNDEIREEDPIEKEQKLSYPYEEELSTWEMLNDFFQTYFGGLTSVLRDELRKFRYIGPIRKTPPRVFAPVRAEDESRWTSGLAAWDVLNKADDSFIQKTNLWLV